MTDAESVRGDASESSLGLGWALGALAVAVAVDIFAQVPLLAVKAGPVSALRNYLLAHRLVLEIAAYQFLTAGVILAAVLLLAVRAVGSTSELGFRFPGWQALMLSALSIGPVLFGTAILVFLFNTLAPGYHLSGNVKNLLGPTRHLSPPLSVALVVWAAIEAPLTEETLFRGILYQGVRNFLNRHVGSWSSIAGAALASGVLFGLAHGELHTFPILAFLGIVLALVFQYTRSVYGSAVLHGLVNAIAVVSFLKP